MKNYITVVLQRFSHEKLSKPTRSPRPHKQPTYGVKPQHTHEPYASHQLHLKETTTIQAISGCLLSYARAVDNELLLPLGSIVTQTHSPTQRTLLITDHLLN